MKSLCSKFVRLVIVVAATVIFGLGLNEIKGAVGTAGSLLILVSATVGLITVTEWLFRVRLKRSWDPELINRKALKPCLNIEGLPVALQLDEEALDLAFGHLRRKEVLNFWILMEDEGEITVIYDGKAASVALSHHDADFRMVSSKNPRDAGVDVKDSLWNVLRGKVPAADLNVEEARRMVEAALGWDELPPNLMWIKVAPGAKA